MEASYVNYLQKTCLERLWLDIWWFRWTNGLNTLVSLPEPNSCFFRHWWHKVLLWRSSIKIEKKNVLETKLLRHPPLQECYLQHHILTFHDLNQTSSILDEENVMQRKRSTHEKLLNIFTWLSAFHFCSTFNEHFLSYNICFLFYATIFN